MSELVQITIGDITGTIIADGTNQPTFETMAERFSAQPADALQAALTATYPDGVIDWSMNCFLLQVRGQNILVDTGVGMGFREEYGQVYSAVSSIIDPADVNRVLITHSHGDHINGLLNAEGERVYPNAEIMMHTAEWDFWLGRDLAGYDPSVDGEKRETLRQAIVDHTTFFEGAETLAPGVTAVPAPGHTPGHFGLMLESGGEQLLALVDTLHFAIQLDHPDWSPIFDDDPVLAAETRRALMARAAGENLLTLVYHFGYPGLGYFSHKDDAFGWTPYEGSV